MYAWEGEQEARLIFRGRLWWVMIMLRLTRTKSDSARRLKEDDASGALKYMNARCK